MTFIESLFYWLMLMSQPSMDAGPGVRGPDRHDSDAKEQTEDYRADEDAEETNCDTQFSKSKSKYQPRWGRISNGL